MRAQLWMAALCATALSVAAGCRQLTIKDGALRCSKSNHCPAPYICHTNGFCYSPSADAGWDTAVPSSADGSGDSHSDAGLEHEAPPLGDGGNDSTEVGAAGQFLLTVTVSGPASTGRVLSTTNGVGIDCGATCSALVNYGTTVQLVATPSSTGVFASWTGCDKATGITCTVSVSKGTFVAAAFKRSNGNVCGSTSDCASTFCVSATCCSTECPGVGVTNGCDLSCSSGTCQHTPEHTPCGTVASFRQPSPTNPDFTDVDLMCDGAGNCTGAKIRCGQNPGVCALGGSMSCCSIYTGMTSTSGFPIFTTQCGPISQCASTGVIIGNNCNSASDCPNGHICCEKEDDSQNLQWSVCVPPGTCVPSGNYIGVTQLCSTSSQECPSGQSCQASTDPQYGTCQ